MTPVVAMTLVSEARSHSELAGDGVRLRGLHVPRPYPLAYVTCAVEPTTSTAPGKTFFASAARMAASARR